MRQAELRAILLRRAVGLGNQVGAACAWSLAEYLSGVVSVQQLPGILPSVWLRRDGGARIRLPLTADERQEGWWLTEEQGHYLCPRYQGRTARLADIQEQGEETDGEYFRDAMWLPAERIRGCQTDYDVWELADAAQVDTEAIRRRWDQVRHLEYLWPPAPPPWSAHWLYRVAGKPTKRGYCFILRGDSREFQVWADARNADQIRHQIHLDLAALMPHEFALRYAADPHSPEEDMSLFWEEISSHPPRFSR